MMLKAVTQKFNHKLCLYIEFSDISNKMFAYRHFRQNGYFPIPWQEIHNSLHSLPPEKRISEKALSKIETAENTVYTQEKRKARKSWAHSTNSCVATSDSRQDALFPTGRCSAC